MKRKFFLILYYGFAYYLPDSYSPLLGKLSNWLRKACVKRIFKKTGKISTICRKAYFGNGKDIEIGDFSGIGKNCILPNNIKIGKYVMMGPNVFFISHNHEYGSTDNPMCFQGKYKGVRKQTVIDDDVWFGANVIVSDGRHIQEGCIIAAGAVVTKDTEPYSIVGGNPAQIIRKRK